MTVLPPELESRYEVLEKLGEGGMGAVYKVRHRLLGHLCVVKVMQARLREFTSLRERFFREARKGKQAAHPNIAAVLDFHVSEAGNAYLIMEYVEGRNLADALVRGPLDYDTVITVGVQTLAALECLHRNKLVHRDISPDNLMLTRDETGAPAVKLIDLGIAKSLEDTSSLTQTGSFLGKAVYASPEQFSNEVDARSDLYSLGVVLYELATGVRPISGANPAALVIAHHNETPRPFAETDPKGRVPETLRRAILKALEKKPAERYQSARDFAEALQNAIPALGKTVVSPRSAVEPATLPATTLLPAQPSSTVQTNATAQPVKPKRPGWRTILSNSRTVKWVGIATVASAIAAITQLAFDHGPYKPEWPTTTQPDASTTAGSTVEVPAPAAPATKSQSEPATPTATAAETPKTAAENLRAGRDLASRRDFASAHAEFKRATMIEPTNAFAWANLGAAAAMLDRGDEARRAYEQAIELDNDNWLAHYNLACLLSRARERQKALDHLAIAVRQLGNSTPDRNILRATLNNMRGDDALANVRNDPNFDAIFDHQ